VGEVGVVELRGGGVGKRVKEGKICQINRSVAFRNIGKEEKSIPYAFFSKDGLRLSGRWQMTCERSC